MNVNQNSCFSSAIRPWNQLPVTIVVVSQALVVSRWGLPVRKYYLQTTYIPLLSYDILSVSEITPCNIIDKPLVIYRFLGNVINDAFNVMHMAKPLRFTLK